MRWYVGKVGYVFGHARFVSHIGLAVLAFGSFLFVLGFLGCVCVLFAFILQMFPALLCGRISGPRFPRNPVLYNPLRVPDVALASRAPSTSSKYFSSYNRWSSWGREHGLTVFPASPSDFAIYLCRLMTESKTASPLESAVHSITWFHQVASRLLLITRWWRVLLPVRSVSWPVKQSRRSLSQSLS